MSHLARSSKDWHHLLELCALFGTLLADQDGVYNPCDSNDRLLLGLKRRRICSLNRKRSPGIVRQHIDGACQALI